VAPAQPGLSQQLRTHQWYLLEQYFLHSAATCPKQEIFLLIVVCSSPENRTRRNAIRQTWGNATGSRGYSVLTVFAVGKAASASTQLEIKEEAQRHRDIIEGSFIDSPQTQTQKMLMSVEWTVTFCPSARYILHTAQDVFVGVPSLAGYLLSLAQQEDIYLGRVVHHGVPDRDPQSPAFVPIHEYPEQFYPDFCHGSAFLMSQDVARKVYVAAREVPLALPPAAFVGICAKRAGITARHTKYFDCCLIHDVCILKKGYNNTNFKATAQPAQILLRNILQHF
uniref:Hexosyltransferase n=1 Tax=Serinus canaria TaxID=9135 RepID=A0A8C9MEN4_SERCA